MAKIDMILRNFHYFYANLVIFHWKYKSEILALQNNSRFSQITQGFEITQANSQKITQATGGFYHSQPPDLRTKKKPELTPPFRSYDGKSGKKGQWKAFLFQTPSTNLPFLHTNQ